MSVFILPKYLNSRVFISALVVSTTLGLAAPASADVIYGPVQSRDTLGKIVNRFYVGPNRSTLQLMKAIVAANPSAFVRGDMNLLKRDALLVLPGNDWLVNEPRFRTPKNVAAPQHSTDASTDVAVANLPDRTPQQMQDRIIFLEAERSSLISQVEVLKRETATLEKKIRQLELDSQKSDEQLLILDKEVIRLTKLLDNQSKLVNGEVSSSELLELQEKLRAVQQETVSLKEELSKAQTELSNNIFLRAQADQTIARLTQENRQLQHVLQESQPGIHYFGETSESPQLSLFGGKLNLPIWLMVLAGALFSLVMVALLATRRKRSGAVNTPDPEPQAADQENGLDLLLETPVAEEERSFAQLAHHPEENVFKMFDEGTLEVDLKLDMAEAYLEVADFESAKSVLREVIADGSELQRRKANRLMQQAA
ncbi:MAG: hypothetical protein CSB47_05320 [Proteobacteria bacterium]|nr:MAG: hypothetical protein CSB47_05320 [Pseudomonadota bacterium]